jgi:hypothetical protein
LIVSRRPTRRIHWQQHPRLWYGEVNKQEPRVVKEGSGTWYYIKSFRDPKDDNQVLHKAGFHTQAKRPMNLEQNIALFILQSYSKSDSGICGEGCIQCCTEYHKYDIDHGGETLISLCCHPKYRGKGYWYDWAIVATENDDGTPRESTHPECRAASSHVLLMMWRG